MLEVMIGIFVFSIISVALAGSAKLMSELSAKNLYKNAAHSIVFDYIEQIKGMDYSVIRKAFDHPSTYDIPTMAVVPVTVGSNKHLKIQDSELKFGIEKRKAVTLDWNNSDNTIKGRKMFMWITPIGLDLNPITVGNANGLQIILKYRWELKNPRSNQEKGRGQIQIVKPEIIEYNYKLE